MTTNLENYLSEALENIYQDAVFIVREKTGLDEAVFPEKCGYALLQLLNKNWFPALLPCNEK